MRATDSSFGSFTIVASVSSGPSTTKAVLSTGPPSNTHPACTGTGMDEVSSVVDDMIVTRSLVSMQMFRMILVGVSS